MDKYQKRYIAHQKRKAKVLEQILKERHSTRQFSDKKVTKKEMVDVVKKMKVYSPSSCNRKSIFLEGMFEKDDISLLSGLLVGGIGWVHRASCVILISADSLAYKEGLFYMPYLDAGIIIQNLYLYLSSKGYKCCYINPNIREKHKKIFKNYFNKIDIFCGAMAVGYEK